MLERLDKPRIISRGEGRLVKLAYLFGFEEDIFQVANKRQEDLTCHQIPQGIGLTRSGYYVRVRYVVDRERFLSVSRIDVAFEPNHWSCFYESGSSRQGHSTTCNGNFHYYFLDSDECVRRYLEDYEQKKILNRLTKKGPHIFPRRKVE